MAHVHHINGRPARRGVTVYGASASGVFRQTSPIEVASLNSPAVDQCGLGGGYHRSRPVASGDFTVGANNAVAAVVLAAPGAGRSHAVHGVDFGYSATPAAGSQLTLTDGTTTYAVPVTAAGVGPLDFRPPMVFTPDAAVSGSLSAGGAGVSGYFGFSARAIV